jgi:class 3 adenylate cyclase
VRVVRSAALVALGLFLMFSAWSAWRGWSRPIQGIYLGLLCPSMLVLAAGTFWRRAGRYLHWLTFSAAWGPLTAGTLMFVARLPEATRPFEPANTILTLIFFYGALRLPYVLACAAGWTFSVLFLAAAARWSLFDHTGLVRAAIQIFSVNALGMYAAYSLERALRLDFLAEREIARERERSERLLLNVLPAAVAQRLKSGEKTIADDYGDVSILFADIVGYTQLSGRLAASELVALLNEVFSRFDALADLHGLEKIKTIGDAYMAVGGLPGSAPEHVEAAVRLALGMLAEIEAINKARGLSLSVRIGIGTGPVVAGVIGSRKFSYDLWGDTVNVASRMESHGVPGRVHLSQSAASRLSPARRVERRDGVDVKGKGAMTTYLLAETGT